MHCLSHSLRASVEALSQFHDSLAIAAAVLFTAVMAFAAVQTSRGNRGWSFWNMIIATILEAAGCALYAIHSQNPTNHMAFLIGFATTNIAPCFLAMATVHVFMCHTTSTMPLEDTSSQSRIVNGSSVFIIFQSGVLVLFDLGLYHIGSYLSAEPVDGITGALDRLSHYEQGVKLLSGSHMLQLVCFGLFIVFQAYWSLKSANSGITLSKRLRFGQSHVSAALSMISVLCMYRSACKLSQYTAVEATSVQLVDSRSDFWLSDAAPILLSLVALCSSFSGLEAQPEACIPYAYLPVPDIKVICVDDERTEGPVKA